MRAAFLIAAKDLAQRIRDKSAILLGLIAPLGLALIFSGIIPDTGGGSFEVSVAVVNNDGGVIAAGFIDEVLPAVEADGVIKLVDYDDEATLLADVEDGYPVAAYIFPAGFSDSVQTGGGGTVQLVGNVDHGIETQIAKAVLDSYLAEVDAIGIAVGAAAVNGEVDLDAIGAAASQTSAAVTVSELAPLLDSPPVPVMSPLKVKGLSVCTSRLVSSVTFPLAS